MKKYMTLVLVAAIVSSLASLESCKRPEPETPKGAVFSGRVVTMNADRKFDPVPEATVTINGKQETTGSNGEFKIAVDPSDRYVLIIRKQEYGIHSQVLTGSVEKRDFILYPATVTEIDPTQNNTVTDTKSKLRPGAFSSQVDWATAKVVPLVYDAAGKLVDFGLPPDILTSVNYVASRKEAGPGISLSLAANSLASGGSAPVGKVKVSMSTVDLFSLDAMPGDFSIAPGNERRAGFMVSFGAGSIEIYDEKNQYQLKSGSTAELSIPVDPSQLVLAKDVPKRVPLFVFDEKTGYWNVDGDSATLNSDKTAYIAKLTHFSSFNMDLEKNNPACLSFRHNSVGVSTLPVYHVETIIPYMGNLIHKQRIVDDPGAAGSRCLTNPNNTGRHMMYNLPGTTNICLIFYEPTPSLKPISMIVMPTGASYGSAIPPACPQENCTDCAGYDESMNNCDDLSACGYAGCSFKVFSRMVDPLIGTAVKESATTIKLKWVHTGGALSFQVWTADNSAGGCVNIANVTPAITSTAIYGGYTMYEASLTPGAGTYTYKIIAGTDEICLDPITLP